MTRRRKRLVVFAVLILIAWGGWYWNSLSPRRAVRAVRLPPDMTFYRSESGGAAFPIFTQRSPHLDRWARSKDDVGATCARLLKWFTDQEKNVSGQGDVTSDVTNTSCSFEFLEHRKRIVVTVFDRDEYGPAPGDGTSFVNVRNA